MLKKLNSFFNIVIGSFIGVFIGFGIYKFWHFKTYPNLYAMQSAPWYTELLLGGALVAVVVVVCIILKLIICRKLKPYLPVYWEVTENEKSKFVERFPELSLFYRFFSQLDSEMICIFPYFCPYAESVREIREIFV